MSIRVGILGYGNLGRGVECASKTKMMIWNLRQYLQEESFRRDNFDRRGSGMQCGRRELEKIRST